MKILRSLVFVMLLPSLLLPAGRYVSPINIPSVEVLNVDVEQCSRACLKKLLKEGKVFSFVAKLNAENANEELYVSLNEIMRSLQIQQAPLELQNAKKSAFNIALVFPRKTIGRYSSNTTNMVLSYLLNQNATFNFEVFDSNTESIDDIQRVIGKIHQGGYKHAIAIFTHVGANNLNKLNINIPVYIPSVHISQIQGEVSKNLIFGGIDYEAQIRALSSLNNNIKTTSFYDSSFIGSALHGYVAKYNQNISYEKVFNQKDSANFPKEMKNLKGAISNSKVFLNTPITSSAIILSQITYNDIKPSGIYSTQINYNPSLLSITQEKDRRNMYIANSISELDIKLIEQSKLIKADLEYDWINYATAFGVEYFYTSKIPSAKRYFKERIVNNQVQYEVEILTPTSSRFESYYE
ncbi:hypothetical protein [Helicobacter ibis]|uniref:Periplasmic protein n=1 Tax=Helicobacter ibis TaxID=2962633 RepID=A0ABT4VDF5_9HELI|nr:hypothetical protein [Helicobacter ibis]MDA3968735.1 hypothetical protein [Helicobacter ibis]